MCYSTFIIDSRCEIECILLVQENDAQFHYFSSLFTYQCESGEVKFIYHATLYLRISLNDVPLHYYIKAANVIG